MPKLKIERINIEKNRRILVTSDIHGHLSHFKNILEKASFCDDDLLVIVGDIIEKGPESLKTLRYIMKLCERGNVIVLIGNVDAWRLHMINDVSEQGLADLYGYISWVRSCNNKNFISFYDELTQELGFITQSPEDILKSKDQIKSHFAKELEFLVTLPTILETQNYIFVHGGLHDKSTENIGDRNLYDFLKYDNFMSTEQCFSKYVVTGHWPVALYSDKIVQCNPIINNEKKIISLDGGCGIKNYGQLNLLIIPEIDCEISDVYYISHDDLPLFCAKTSQEASTDSINIRFIDNEIRVLEKGEEFSKIKHVSSGRTLDIPTSYVYDEIHCHEYTDYDLSVNSGDTLSLVKQLSGKYLVKKNGIVGWYYGELEE